MDPDTIYKYGEKATLDNEPPDADNKSSYDKTLYFIDLWRDWYSNLSDISRFDYMFQEVPEKFRTTENILCQSALTVFDKDFARDRWNIVSPSALEEKIESNKISHKETFPEADCYKAKVSTKTVDNNSITAAQAFAEINSLVDELEYHEKKYYEDNDPEISDYDFDMKLKRLEELEKQFPEFKQSESPTERVGRENLE